MLYNGINIDVNAEQHKVIVDFLDSQDNQGFETFMPYGSDGANVEIWWDSLYQHPEFSGIDGPSSNEDGSRNIVTENSYDAKSPDDFINAFNHWKEHGVLDSEVFK
ncbi:DNA primase/helicase [Acinetobacter virus vB_AbaP_AGC01]|uniref:DNA primase/helicase n=1 Tax=Acinetobacter virus vB_AbaP_AGC01 TaxID=2723754 RepID=A0A6H0X2F4_9CAUD|nr:DNA primase/helicase [Acinetobacter virus vB_AbaP_AGC01]